MSEQPIPNRGDHAIVLYTSSDKFHIAAITERVKHATRDDLWRGQILCNANPQYYFRLAKDSKPNRCWHCFRRWQLAGHPPLLGYVSDDVPAVGDIELPWGWREVEAVGYESDAKPTSDTDPKKKELRRFQRGRRIVRIAEVTQEHRASELPSARRGGAGKDLAQLGASERPVDPERGCRGDLQGAPAVDGARREESPEARELHKQETESHQRARRTGAAIQTSMKETTHTYVFPVYRDKLDTPWRAVLDGIPVRATFNSKGAAEAGIEVERRRRAEACAPKAERETIPCELCGQPTRMLGTKRCDRCWDLERRINRDQQLAAMILEVAEKEQQRREAARSAGSPESWTPEPWPEYCNDESAPDLELQINYARARDCVNACRGLADPAAELARFRKLCGEAHEAIDRLFATLCSRPEFAYLPSASGQPWETIQKLKEFAKQ